MYSFCIFLALNLVLSPHNLSLNKNTPSHVFLHPSVPFASFTDTSSSSFLLLCFFHWHLLILSSSLLLREAGRCHQLHIFFVITRAAVAPSRPRRKWLISAAVCISQPPRSQTDDWWTLTSCVSWTYWQASKETLTSASFFYFAVQYMQTRTMCGRMQCERTHIHYTHSAVQMLPPVSQRMQKGWDRQTAGVGRAAETDRPCGKTAGRKTYHTSRLFTECEIRKIIYSFYRNRWDADEEQEMLQWRNVKG